MPTATGTDRLVALRLHPLSFSSAVARIDRLNRREQTVTELIRENVEAWAVGYLYQLSNTFYQHFVSNWDLVTAKREGVDDDLYEDAVDLLDVAEEEVTDDIEDTLEDGIRDGFAAALWDLYRAGRISEDQLIDVDIPDDDAIGAFLAAGVGGIATAARVSRWFGDAKVRSRLGITAMLGRGMTLSEGQDLFDTIGAQLGGHLEGLAASELQRAFEFGQKLALDRALVGREPGEHDVDLVWLTRRDGKVCPLCQALDGTVTLLEPIVDSHPKCRCIKVPVFYADELEIRGGVQLEDFEAWLYRE